MPLNAAKARARRLALLSIGVAFGVMALKFAAYAVTGSVALFSDALETVVNVLASMVAFWAIGYAHRPADEDHPFGHHKAEYLAAVLEGILIVGAAALILYAVVDQLRAGLIVITEPGLGLAINLVAAGVNAAWASYLLREGTRLRSPALQADARHIRADVVTSLGVAVGIVLALLTGWLVLDPLLAILVALSVVWQGAKLLQSSIGGLMDRSVPEDEAVEIAETIRTHMEGAIEVHDIRMREAGPAVFVDCHLVVPGAMSVARAHRICDAIEAALARDHPHVRATIHVEPEHEAVGESV